MSICQGWKPALAGRLIGLWLLGILAAPHAMAVGVANLGSWQNVLEGRDLDGDPATAEAYFDLTANITWLADANHARTIGADTDGRMSWADAEAFVSGLSVHGVTGWRQPTVAPVNGTAFQANHSFDGSTDRGCAGPEGWIGPAGELTSELGHLFYVVLGNDPTACDASQPGSHPAGGGLANTGPFRNLAVEQDSNFDARYWTGTRTTPFYPYRDPFPFVLSFVSGEQLLQATGNLRVWPVMSGDVGAPTTTTLPYLKNAPPLVQIGRLNTGDPGGMDSQSFRRQAFGHRMNRPVVIIGPASLDVGPAGIRRLRNITSTGFDTRFQPWDNSALDSEPLETAALAVETGRYRMPDGSVWEAGTLEHSHTFSWKRRDFGASFPGQPKLLLTIQSYHGASPVIARARNVTATGFEVRMFEAEAEMNWHAREVIGYLAIHSPSGKGTVEIEGSSGFREFRWAIMPYRLGTLTANHNPSPSFQTYGGLRQLLVEEDQTFDQEQFHTGERIDILDLRNELGLTDGFYAQDVSTRGGDPAGLRTVTP